VVPAPESWPPSQPTVSRQPSRSLVEGPTVNSLQYDNAARRASIGTQTSTTETSAQAGHRPGTWEYRRGYFGCLANRQVKSC
jgi:hypothetical protein